VDLELVLAVDVSGSINTEHAYLQRSGYARALRGCPGRCCKWMGVAQVDNYAASPRLARLEWSARVVARAAFRASRASLSFGNCL